MSSEYKAVRIEKSEGIAEVILIGPGKGNAMGPDFWREMPDVFTRLDRDDEVRAIIVRGSGNNFSFGLDLAAMMSNLGQHLGSANLAAERTVLLDQVLEMQQAFNSVEACRKPVIAAIHGWCIGGGLDLIAACDIRLCSEDARFSLRETKVAIVADLGSLQRLPRIIGEGNTRELAFTGKDITAARALSMNLVNEVQETPEALLEAARATAREIAANPPLVVQGTKRVMNHCADKSVKEGLEYVAVWNSAFLQSHDFGEAMTAFMERRPPQYKGR